MIVFSDSIQRCLLKYVNICTHYAYMCAYMYKLTIQNHNVALKLCLQFTSLKRIVFFQFFCCCQFNLLSSYFVNFLMFDYISQFFVSVLFLSFCVGSLRFRWVQRPDLPRWWPSNRRPYQVQSW